MSDIIIVKNKHGDEYLLFKLACSFCDIRARLEIHKVFQKPDGTKGVKFLRQWFGAFLEFTDSTGLTVSPDGNPIIAVYEGSGGIGPWGYDVSILEAVRNTVDITPRWAGRIVGVGDLEGNGRIVVLAVDGRWSGAFDTRSSAGPHIPVVLQRDGDGFYAVCSDFAKFYREQVAQIDTFMNENAYANHPYGIELKAGMALHLAQAGLFDEAQKYARLLKGDVAQYDQLFSGPYALAYKEAGESIPAFIEKAHRDGLASCYVSSTPGEGNHTGLEERVNAFRQD